MTMTTCKHVHTHTHNSAHCNQIFIERERGSRGIGHVSTRSDLLCSIDWVDYHHKQRIKSFVCYAYKQQRTHVINHIPGICVYVISKWVRNIYFRGYCFRFKIVLKIIRNPNMLNTNCMQNYEIRTRRNGQRLEFSKLGQIEMYFTYRIKLNYLKKNSA